MHEDFVTYEQAVKLEELGFDWECTYGYYIHSWMDEPKLTSYHACKEVSESYDGTDYYFAPTLAQVQKWLREKYKIWIEPAICMSDINQYFCDIYDLKKVYGDNYMDDAITYIKETFYTPEDALSAGIDKAFELLTMKD